MRRIPVGRERILIAAALGCRIQYRLDGRWIEAHAVDLTGNVEQRVHPEDEPTNRIDPEATRAMEDAT